MEAAIVANTAEKAVIAIGKRSIAAAAITRAPATEEDPPEAE